MVVPEMQRSVKYYDVLNVITNLSCQLSYSTSETRFSEPRFSEILDLMNKLQLTFSYFTLYLHRLDLVNRLNLVNKRGLTNTFTKSSLRCTHTIIS